MTNPVKLRSILPGMCEWERLVGTCSMNTVGRSYMEHVSYEHNNQYSKLRFKVVHRQGAEG